MRTTTQLNACWGRIKGQREVQVSSAQWTTPSCPPDNTRVTPDLGIKRLSHVDAHRGPTLLRRVVIPNPQHLLLTLSFETPLHEEKCPL